MIEEARVKSGAQPIALGWARSRPNYAGSCRRPECEYPGTRPDDLLFYLASVRKHWFISATGKAQPPAEEYGVGVGSLTRQGPQRSATPWGPELATPQSGEI